MRFTKWTDIVPIKGAVLLLWLGLEVLFIAYVGEGMVVGARKTFISIGTIKGMMIQNNNDFPKMKNPKWV